MSSSQVPVKKPKITPEEKQHIARMRYIIKYIDLIDHIHHKAINTKKLFDYISDNDILNLPIIKVGSLPTLFRDKLDDIEPIDIPEIEDYNPIVWVPIMKSKLFSKSD